MYSASAVGILRFVEAQAASGAEGGLQSLAQAIGIVFYYGGGGVEDRLRGAVIFFQANDFRVREIVREAFQIAGAGAAPGVDGLVFVADDADVLARAGEQADEFFLRAVGVLEFVHHDVVKAGIPGGADVGMIAKQVHGAEKQIVKIEGAGFAQDFVVGAEDGGGFLARFVAGLRGVGFHVVGSEAVIFGVADLGAHGAGRVIVGGEVELGESAFYGGGLVVVIVDREIARQAEVMGFAADQARAEGMKSGDPDVGGVAPGGAQQVADAVFHYGRRLCW